MAVLGLVTSQTDCGVPGCWFSHATGLAHDGEACAAAEEADTTCACPTTRAQVMATAVAATIERRCRLRPRAPKRAAGVLHFGCARTSFTVFPPHRQTHDVVAPP